MKYYFTTIGEQVLVEVKDNQEVLQCKLVTKEAAKTLAVWLTSVYGKDAVIYVEAPLEETLKHYNHGVSNVEQ